MRGHFVTSSLFWALLSLPHPILGAEQPQQRIGFNYSSENLDHGLPSWQLQSLQWQLEQKKSSTYGLEVNRYQRFSQTDLSFSGQYIHFLTSDWYLDSTLTYTPNATVIKRHSGEIWSHHAFAQGLGMGVGMNMAAYPTDTIDIRTSALKLEIEKYITAFRFAYRITSTRVNLPGTSSQDLYAHMFTSAYYYNDKSNFSLSLATGREIENDGSASPPISQIQAISVKHSHFYNKQWRSDISLSWHQQGSFYNRSGISIGLSYGF